MVKSTGQKVVLSIAGFDPSGGAGVLADIKTFAAFGCYGVAVVTGITFQNTKGVFGTDNQTADTTLKQLEPLFDDFEILAIKTGMLPTAEIISVVAEVVRSRQVPIVVVDPVLESSSGFRLIDDRALEAIKQELLPLASLVTPNAAEAQRLSGVDIRDQLGKQRVAEAILKTGVRGVLITGGDEVSEDASDLLMDSQGPTIFSTQRIGSIHTHGTGCTLAAALACLQAQGRSLRESVPIAKEYVARGIESAPGIGGGNGPLNHFPAGFPDHLRG